MEVPGLDDMAQVEAYIEREEKEKRAEIQALGTPAVRGGAEPARERKRSSQASGKATSRLRYHDNQGGGCIRKRGGQLSPEQELQRPSKVNTEK